MSSSSASSSGCASEPDRKTPPRRFTRTAAAVSGVTITPGTRCFTNLVLAETVDGKRVADKRVSEADGEEAVEDSRGNNESRDLSLSGFALTLAKRMLLVCGVVWVDVMAMPAW